MSTADGNVSGKCIYKIYHSEENQGSAIFDKITDKHLYYDTFDKMRVSLAVQIISFSVAQGIEKMLDSDIFDDDEEKLEAKNAVVVLKNMNDLFDILNAKVCTDENPLKRGVSSQNIDALIEFSYYVSCIESLGASKVFWITGLQQTVNAVIQLYEMKVVIDADFVIFTRRLNQDALENLFGLIRAHGGNNRNPSLLEFLRTLSKIMTSSLNINFGDSNCLREADSKIQLLDLKPDEAVVNEWIDVDDEVQIMLTIHSNVLKDKMLQHTSFVSIFLETSYLNLQLTRLDRFSI